jgi:acetolactate synthase-1/2/3 large subunit
MAKWVAQIDRADRVPEYIARAFQVATSGRPGPVVLALPEDMLAQTVEVADTLHYTPVQAYPSPAQLSQLRSMLEAAERPVLILGGSGWDQTACTQLREFAELNHLPVACAFRFQDLLDNAHPNYIGDVGIGINPQLAKRIQQADLVIAIGPRLGEMTTGGYTLLEAPLPKQTLVHVHSDALELGRVYQAPLMINSGMKEFAHALSELSKQGKLKAPPAGSTAWRKPKQNCKPGNRNPPFLPKKMRRSICGKWCRTSCAGTGGQHHHQWRR